MPNENIRPTVTISDRGDISLSMPVGSFQEGLADLLDFKAPLVRVTAMPPGAPTAIGFGRAGQALRDAMGAFATRTAAATIAGVGSLTVSAKVERTAATATAKAGEHEP